MTKRIVTSLDDLLSLTELRGVRVYEVSAKRRDGFELEDVPIEPNSSDLKVSLLLDDDNNLAFRGRIDIGTKNAVLAADVAARFRLAEAIEEPSDELMDEFSRMVGLSVLMPYLRAEIHNGARQIGVPAPVLKHYWSRDYENMHIANSPEELAELGEEKQAARKLAGDDNS